MSSFDDRYSKLAEKLNKAQREAVDTIEGPVMVIAGPGTGKTTILTLRIANILKSTDTPPDAILALTFTESGARAMRKKLAELIGAAAYRVKLHTFHSFANDIIKTYPDKFPRIIGAEHVEGLEQIALVEKMLDGGTEEMGKHIDFDILRPKGDPAYYVSKVISAIKDLKRDDISPKAFVKLIVAEEKAILSVDDLKHEKGKYAGKIKGEYQERLDAVAKNRELARAYVAYEKALEENHLYDFEDMIIEVVRRLAADEDLRMRVQEECHYILADEHQDANTAQNELLELVASFHENPNLFIVGDEKQAIFRFQGASLENFLYFKKRFPEAKLISLTDNYRSHQTILDASHALIGNNVLADKSLRVELSAKGGGIVRKIDCIALPDVENELSFVANEAKKLIESGAKPDDIAVLVRNNKHAEAVERAFAAKSVPVARYADADALDHPYAEAFFAVVRAALHISDNELVAKAMLAPFLKLDVIEVSRALEEWRKVKGSLIDTLKLRESTKELARLLVRFARLASSDPAVQAFETIAIESGFVEFVVGHEHSRELVPLYAALLSTVTRFAERERAATLGDFITRLDHAREHGYSISASYIPPEGVELMTAHGSKGLEFEYVFIVHASDNVWGGKTPRRAFKLPTQTVSAEGGDSEASDDERRLFYVALTRAKKHAYITYAEHGDDGRELSPSRFILEIPEVNISKTSVSVPFEISKRNVSSGDFGALGILRDPSYLRSLFLERGLSVTHLNNFLECPWKYFFLNLILLPKAQENPQLYGSAVHQALCHYFEAYKREEDISINEAADLFEKYLRRSHMTERDLKDYTKSGKEEIKAYLSEYEFPRNILNEYKVAGVPFIVKGEDGVEVEVTLKGNLDKVEIGNGGHVNVVDYKTGKPQSRNKLEGKTKDADGNYLRQLAFYKLILDRYKKGEWTMDTGTLDFIKPDDGGKLHREVFIVTDAEVKALEIVVADVSRKILALNLESCNDEDCEWCRLRNSLELRR